MWYFPYHRLIILRLIQCASYVKGFEQTGQHEFEQGRNAVTARIQAKENGYNMIPFSGLIVSFHSRLYSVPDHQGLPKPQPHSSGLDRCGCPKHRRAGGSLCDRKGSADVAIWYKGCKVQEVGTGIWYSGLSMDCGEDYIQEMSTNNRDLTNWWGSLQSMDTISCRQAMRAQSIYIILQTDHYCQSLRLTRNVLSRYSTVVQ
jgi:hypothetical protein